MAISESALRYSSYVNNRSRSVGLTGFLTLILHHWIFLGLGNCQNEFAGDKCVVFASVVQKQGNDLWVSYMMLRSAHLFKNTLTFSSYIQLVEWCAWFIYFLLKLIVNILWEHKVKNVLIQLSWCYNEEKKALLFELIVRMKTIWSSLAWSQLFQLLLLYFKNKLRHIQICGSGTKWLCQKIH